MKKSYFLDEEEKNRILSIHESTVKKQYLSEATEKGGAAYVNPTTDTPDAKIAREFYGASSGPGTNADIMIKSIQSIISPEQFWKVNELVKNLSGNSGKLDIVGIINDEFEYYGDDSESNAKDLNSIYGALNKIGIKSVVKKSKSGKYEPKTFRITSQPVTQQPVVQQPLTPKQDVVKQQQKVQQRRQQITQQTQRTTKEIQNLLGQDQTGNLDSLNVEKMIDLLR